LLKDMLKNIIYTENCEDAKNCGTT